MPSRLSPALSAVVATLLLSFHAAAAELQVDPAEMPRFAAQEPAEALGTFVVKPGFRLELAAHEPLVVDPVTMCFDERGRLFVVEMIDYAERREEDPHLGRLRLLTDTDGDGRFDQATIYADALPWPTAVTCYDGGVFIGATPDIIWCRDNDGDGRADERKVVFTGFGAKAAKLNVQGLFNSFQWGLDNRIHGTCGTVIGSEVVRPDEPRMVPLTLNRVDFSFCPKRLDLRPETGGGQYGMSFDSAGRKFLCSNSDHAQMSMYEYRYLSGDPLRPLPPHRVSIAEEGRAAEVFRLSADEPWRVIRTRWRISGVAKGMVEGGGRVSGYFTGATGLTVFQGDAYGSEFVDNLFVGDAGGNLVHRKEVDYSSLPPIARRPADERRSEFIASTDNWFRPVHFASGPDGCLYIADMYRETIEHPWSLPEPIKRHLDLNSGNDRGRIYRVAKDGFKHPGGTDLGAVGSRDLISLLGHPNGWHRATAARLLFQRAEPQFPKFIRQAWGEELGSLGKIQALHLLAALARPDVELIGRALTDPDARVRVHGLKLAETVPTDRLMRERLGKLAVDGSAAVRFQLALTLGKIDGPDVAAALKSLLQNPNDNDWVRDAALNALRTDLGETFEALMVSNSTAAIAVAEIAGASGDASAVARLIRLIDENWNDTASLPSLTALDVGLRSRRSGLMDQLRGTGLLQRFAGLLETAGDMSAPDESRIRALRALGLTGFDYCGRALVRCLSPGVASAVRRAGLAVLLDMRGIDAYLAVLQNWALFDKAERLLVLKESLSLGARTRALLAGVGRGEIEKELFSGHQIDGLRSHRDRAVAEAARRVFGPPAGPVSTADLVLRYRESLRIEGNPTAGRQIFDLRCAACHRAAGQGHSLGPDLVTVKSKGRENLLLNILAPNAEVAPQYVAFEVEIGGAGGESFTALIANETPGQLTLKMPGGIGRTINRRDVTGMRSGGLSLMPEGLYDGLTPAQMADLLRFVETAD